MARVRIDRLDRISSDGTSYATETEVATDLSGYATTADLGDYTTTADLAESTGAAGIGYDNTDSDLVATDVQAAIDEIAASSGSGGLEFLTVIDAVTVDGSGTGTISLDTGDATLKLGAILGFSVTWVAGSANINPTILAPRNGSNPGPIVYGGVMNGGGVSEATPTKYGPQTSDMSGATTVPWSFVGQAMAGVIEMEFSNCAENDQFTVTAKILKLF